MWRLPTLLTIAALGACAVASGCGGEDGGADVTAADVAGNYYVATKVTGHTLVPQSTLSLSFNDKTRLSAAAGCNTLVGPFTIEDGTLRLSGKAAGTLMGCEPALQAQDAWLDRLLTKGVKIASAADDGLTLTQGDVRIELADSDEGAAKDGAGADGGGGAAGHKPVVGTQWRLLRAVSADGKTTLTAPGGDAAPVLELSPDGTVSVFTGCNTGSGTAKVGDDGTAVFGDIALTRVGCLGDEADLEAAIVQVLQGTTSLAFDGQGDLVIARNGDHLVYTAG